MERGPWDWDSISLNLSFLIFRVDGNDNGLLESLCGLHEMMSGRCFAHSRGSGRTQGAAPDLDERGTQGQASSVTMSAV